MFGHSLLPAKPHHIRIATCISILAGASLTILSQAAAQTVDETVSYLNRYLRAVTVIEIDEKVRLEPKTWINQDSPWKTTQYYKGAITFDGIFLRYASVTEYIVKMGDTLVMPPFSTKVDVRTCTTSVSEAATSVRYLVKLQCAGDAAEVQTKAFGRTITERSTDAYLFTSDLETAERVSRAIDHLVKNAQAVDAADPFKS